MAQPDPYQARLAKLQQWRNPPAGDPALGAFLKQQFQREVARPHKQLQAVISLWEELVPAELARHTRLESLNRGVLRVTVEGSARRYELDRLLRGGLERELITRHKSGKLRRVALHSGEVDSPAKA